MDDLDRLFQRLVAAIRSEHPEYLSRPFEISELYQKLVPYRHHRRELQIDTNQDYELAVTRLLSGERGLLVGDEGMQEFLRTELASPNPDTGVFREFGSNHVAIAPGALERLLGESARGGGATRRMTPASPEAAVPTPERDTRTATPPDAAPEGVRVREPASTLRTPVATEGSDPPAASGAPEPLRAPEAVTPAAPVSDEIPPTTIPAPAPVPAPETDMATRAVTASDLGGKCRYCSGTLPNGRKLVFCPHCGQNLTVYRCPACSSELEMGWKFCVTCGRSASAPAT